MTEKDEDIEIIDPSEGHQNSYAPPTFIIKSGSEENPNASHHALMQAYEDIRRKLQQSKSQNEALRQTIIDMEYSRQGNRSNSNMFGAAGPVGASAGADQEDQNAHFKAQIGYADSMQRQLMRAQAKIVGLENEIKELKSNAINNKQIAVVDPAVLQSKINEFSSKNSQLMEKNNKLTNELNAMKLLLYEKTQEIEQLKKQKDPNIMTEPFTIKIQELKTEMREKDEHIAALMDRLKMQKSLQQEWTTTMPESGYNTRMNEDQQLLTFEESKQILIEIERHKKTLRTFLHQLKNQTDTIQKQGQIINELKIRTGTANGVRVPADGSIALHNREPSSSWQSSVFADMSKKNEIVMGTGARPKDSSYTFSNSRILNTAAISKASSSPVLLPSDDNLGLGDPLFGQGRAGVGNTKYSSSINYVPLSVDNSSRTYMPSDIGSKFSPSILVPSQNTDITSQGAFTSANLQGIKESTAMIESNHVTDANVSQTKTTAQVCPVCNREFPTMSMEDFQQHVFECIDDGDDDPLQTLQNPTIEDVNGIDRICPMCNKAFANTLPLSDFEKHVQDHFNEESIVDRFEVLHP